MICVKDCNDITPYLIIKALECTYDCLIDGCSWGWLVSSFSFVYDLVEVNLKSPFHQYWFSMRRLFLVFLC